MSQEYTAGTLTLSFTTPEGKTYTWKQNTQDKQFHYKFYAVSWEDADPATHPEFYETPEIKEIGNAVERWTAFTDSDGTLVVIGAVKGDNITLTEYMDWLLDPMGTVIEHETLPSHKDLNRGWILNDLPSIYVISATKLASHPFFEIGTTP